MHEMAICQGIVEVLEEQALSQHFQRVEKVRLEIGPMAGVEIAAIRFCFDAVAKGTVANKAVLEIIETKGEAWCMSCSENITVTGRYEACPDCGSYQLQVTGGDELRIKDLEVN